MRWYEAAMLAIIFFGALSVHVAIRSGSMPCNHACYWCHRPLEVQK
jgi:hypothetical protein